MAVSFSPVHAPFRPFANAGIWLATELPAPPANLVLKKIAIGHGIQNYSCTADLTKPADAKGALAVLYDVTSLYPGNPKGLSQAAFEALTTTVLWTQPIPLNLVNPQAAKPGVVLASKEYAATSKPFKAPADIKVGNTPPLKFLGRHYFDGSGTPTFDLSEAKLRAGVGKTGEANVPANADKGPLKTGAVKWLQLSDTGLGLSKGVTVVYRVITAGGVAESCTTTNGGTGSVPYTAFYWFYG